MGATIEAIDPLVRRILASNPSPFTFTGTWTHIVGHGRIAVIDPGPDLPAHVEDILAATQGETIAAILVTHNHRDHSPAGRALAAASGAPIVGCAPLTVEDEGGFDAAFDRDHAPDRVMTDGEMLHGDGWSLEAVATPGHTSNHLCFALAEANALFSGDHVMGWSTSIVSPPDGDMGDYLASLEKLLARNETRYFPAHGDPVDNPRRLVRGMIGHRKQREGQILRLLEKGEITIPQMVDHMYRGIDPRLHPAAARSVLAHLIDLERRELIDTEGDAWRMR